MSEPMRILAIVPTARDPQRATIRVGRSDATTGKPAATLSARSISDLGLTVGQPWDEKRAAAVEQAALHDKAMREAMRRLNRQAMSRRDLDRKLADAEFEPHLREAVLDRLEELNLLDDAAYGRALIRQWQASGPAGPKLLRQKLYQKGLDRATIDQVVDESRDDDEQLTAALEFARKRVARLQRFDPVTRKRRLYGQLARRGFDAPIIDAALQQVLTRDDV